MQSSVKEQLGPVALGLPASDWETLGNLIRQRTLQAVAAHFAQLGMNRANDPTMADPLAGGQTE